MHLAKLVGVRHHNDKIASFDFEAPKGFRYLAGQFVEVQLDHQPADDRGGQRWFSLSSAPHEPQLSISTRIDAQPLSSFKRQLLNLPLGDTSVHLSDPMGDFVLPRTDALPIIYLAAGIGIAPVRAVMTAARHAGRRPEAYLWYAVTHQRDIVFLDEIADLLTSHTIVEGTQQFRESHRTTSRLTLSDVTTQLPVEVKNTCLYYIAGPDQFVADLKTQLEHTGIDQSRLVTDYFGNYNSI